MWRRSCLHFSGLQAPLPSKNRPLGGFSAARGLRHGDAVTCHYRPAPQRASWTIWWATESFVTASHYHQHTNQFRPRPARSFQPCLHPDPSCERTFQAYICSPICESEYYQPTSTKLYRCRLLVQTASLKFRLEHSRVQLQSANALQPLKVESTRTWSFYRFHCPSSDG